MGLFDFMKKNNDCAKRDSVNVPKYDNGNKIQFDLDYQNNLLFRVNAAREKYKNDKDITSAIKEYEFAFVESNPPCESSQDIDLAKLYITAEEYDKAWGYLNQLILRRKYPDSEIKFLQAKVLKREEKYAYAIEMIALGYYYKTLNGNEFQKDKFQKDILSSVKKLGWNQENIEGIIELCVSQKNKSGLSEEILVKKLREYMNCL